MNPRTSALPSRRPCRGTLAVLLLAAVGPAFAAPERTDEAGDPLFAAVSDVERRLAVSPTLDELFGSVHADANREARRAAAALEAGGRWEALRRLGLALGGLAPLELIGGLPEEKRDDPTTFRAAWAELDREIDRVDRGGVDGLHFDGVPAAARAIGEAALSEADGYREASLEYGLQTSPVNGLYYLGVGWSRLELARLASRLRARQPTAEAPLGGVAPEVAALERELLAAYVPPASIDAHPDFIRISSLLQRASALDEAGSRHGALYRLLEARLELSRLLRPEGSTTLRELAEAARARPASPGEPGADPGLRGLFLERARAAAEAAPTNGTGDREGGPGALGAAVLADVLPLHDAALGPAPPSPPPVEPRATVTLVRWPYT